MNIDWNVNRKIAENILQCIGRTPMVRLNNVVKNINANIYGKIEFFSPTGSLKDRIYYEMLTRAVKEGKLRKGMKILEASTGNAGISCAFVCALLGFDVTIVMPSGMSEERKKIMRAYGAKIIETPGGESDVDLCIEKIKELKTKEPGVYWEPAQFRNENNIDAHYRTTGPEIWEQTNGKVEAFLASQGTGGTLSGVGKYLKEKKHSVKLFAVEPSEAPLLSKRKWGTHRIEGIGDGFVPQNLNLALINGIITTTSDEAIQMAKKLAEEEGIFCGISSGCNVSAAIKLAKRFPEIKHIVTMINDTGQRYFSTELCDVKKKLEIPEREHPIDDYSEKQLGKYQKNWIIID